MASDRYLSSAASRPFVDKVQVSDVYQNYTKAGNLSSYGVDLEFAELGLWKTIKASERYLLRSKIADTINSWEAKYKRHLDKQHKETREASVEAKNRRAKEDLEALHGILSHTLGVQDAVDWNALKRKDAFRIRPRDIFPHREVPPFIEFNSFGRPVGYEEVTAPKEPTFNQVLQKYGFLSKRFRRKAITKEYEAALAKWSLDRKSAEGENTERKLAYEDAERGFESKKVAFEREKQQENESIEDLKVRYQSQEPRSVEEYCDLVLNASTYPDYFPKNWTLEYRPESRILVVEYDVPPPDRLPATKAFRYVKSRDEITEKLLTDAARKKLYDSVTYQICIRTIHELFEADVVDALDAVAFNGVVTHTNPATGTEETKVIISVSASKEQFVAFDLSKVDPKATFKLLKGVAAAQLIDLTPIPPVIQMDRTDKRFVDGREVVTQLDNSVNLAAMHWEDFEHLIRELFETEFAASGGEVRVTQASSDGGVDAIAFDPDPIRGGKIVIQAKRYTNTVGVAAVRDLYGTVMNEGATKGILVTTSDYGKDSYEFAKDKPLTLLNGSNLLSLLEKHGHRAKIDVAEAKRIVKG